MGHKESNQTNKHKYQNLMYTPIFNTDWLNLLRMVTYWQIARHPFHIVCPSPVHTGSTSKGLHPQFFPPLSGSHNTGAGTTGGALPHGQGPRQAIPTYLKCVTTRDLLNLLSSQPRVTVTSCFVYNVISELESIDHLRINPILWIGLIHK